MTENTKLSFSLKKKKELDSSIFSHTSNKQQATSNTTSRIIGVNTGSFPHQTNHKK